MVNIFSIQKDLENVVETPTPKHRQLSFGKSGSVILFLPSIPLLLPRLILHHPPRQGGRRGGVQQEGKVLDDSREKVSSVQLGAFSAQKLYSSSRPSRQKHPRAVEARPPPFLRLFTSLLERFFARSILSI
ncbi:hypothetical protein NPIL_179331 [Nephila pilipes]|uniref:Uncharacterized protein n=1 Tax=Nephila pilipes TaxID=299642 RepID=A0A8X6TG72_NEPPI|nr:hypothetical protein NPIL_179331 [Nephila pilipes]